MGPGRPATNVLSDACNPVKTVLLLCGDVERRSIISEDRLGKFSQPSL